MKKRNCLVTLLCVLCLLCTLFTACEFTQQMLCEHQYTEEQIPPTCTTDGAIKKTCSLCGDQRSINIKAQGHQYTEWEAVTEATCTAEGLQARHCTKCQEEEKRSLPMKEHSFGKTVEVSADCTTEGYRQKTCTVCSYTEKQITAPKGEHSYGAWETVTVGSATQNGVDERACSVCGDVEQRVTFTMAYVDASVLFYEFDSTATPTFSNEEDFILHYRAAVFNQAESVQCQLSFPYGSLKDLLTHASDASDAPFGHGVSASVLDNQLTLTFSYEPLPSTKTESNSRYPQLPSMNYSPVTNGRADDFDAFPIESGEGGYPVTTSDQLFYCLERRVKPLPVQGSAAERMYNAAKAVLRDIIDEDMTDVEKLRAIYDWLIMNVTYDRALYDKIGSGEDLKAYNGFYLEGVFDDGYAVCDGISKAFAVMANIEGIPCVQVSGLYNDPAVSVGHAWNKVFVLDSWYVVDATSGGTILQGQEVLSLAYFLISDSLLLKEYTPANYQNLQANKTYNPYASNTFTYKGNTYDFEAASQEELNAILGLLATTATEKSSVQFRFAFDFGDSGIDEIQAAFASADIPASFRYIVDGEHDEIYLFIWPL